jgi:DNA-damage-inducible protein D
MTILAAPLKWSGNSQLIEADYLASIAKLKGFCMTASPNFEAIRQETEDGKEFWSARDLATLLGYDTWQRFEDAIKRAKVACRQVQQEESNHFSGAAKMVKPGSGVKRKIKDYVLSRFACYLIAQNGDPRKEEIAYAQAYFATTTREREVFRLYQEQQERLLLREQFEENNQALKDAAGRAGVLPKQWGQFENAGYEGLYGGLNKEQIKEHKGIAPKEDLLDRMGRAELAANSFRVTQTELKLSDDRTIGLNSANQTHNTVAKEVRKAIERIGGVMPENLPAEPSLRPLLKQKRRNNKKLAEQPTEYIIESGKNNVPE